MAKLLPLHPGMGRLVIGPKPHTAPTYSSTKRVGRPAGSRQTWSHRNGGRWLTLQQVEHLVSSRLADIQSAFMTVDPDGTGLVSREEFRRVLESILCLSRTKLNMFLNEVCESSSGSVDYRQFVRSFRRAPVVHRPYSSCSSVMPGPQNTSMSLSDIQKNLRDKIGDNLRTMIRVFRLFDSNREGHIQQQEFRRIIENHCLHLTDKQFQRLWNHYSPSNSSTISYDLFLEKLGFGDRHDSHIAPICTKIELSIRGRTPSVKTRNQKPESFSSSDYPSVLQQRKQQALFYDKMCINLTPVWKALQAVDTTHSGLVKPDILRAVLSSFIFPMNPQSFQKLTNRYGVTATGPVRWRHFLGCFTSPFTDETDTSPHSDGAFERPDIENLNLQDLYPRLKEIFQLLDTGGTGRITRADLRHLLERPRRTHLQTLRHHLHHSQIRELLNALDRDHTGIIQLVTLERLDSSMTSAPEGNTASPDSPAEPLDVSKEKGHTDEQQKTPDEEKTTQSQDNNSVISASWRAVESLLLEKLCEQLGSVLAALEHCDPQNTGCVPQEELKKVLCRYGVAVSDTHLTELCETSNSRHGDSSALIYYVGFLRSLGVPLPGGTHTSLSNKDSHTPRRPCTPQSTPQSARGQRSPLSLQVRPETCNILGITFQTIKRKLEQRHSSLTDRIRAFTSSEGMLSEVDVRKILEDSWVPLDDNHFSKFTELLGFRDGRIECSVFLAKYEEATARNIQQAAEGHGGKEEVFLSLTSAEECLAAMDTRIKAIHGNKLTAFRLMDRRRRGVVDCHDFKVLYNSLRFFCGEEEHQRLLDLIGLHPGKNLNYSEFVDVIENNGKCKHGTQTASVQEQLHELLAHDAGYKWADMSKVLCQLDSDGHGWIHKKGLRELLFTYALPLRSDEFDQLWLRYDPEGRGRVPLFDFLERLGFPHEGDLPQSQKLKHTVDADKHVTSADPARKSPGFNVSMNPKNKRLPDMNLPHASDQKAEKMEHRPATPEAVHQTESLDGLSPGLVLARMEELVTASAVNLYKAFMVFDRSGSGMIRALDFRQVLDQFCARLSDKQYRYMLTRLELDCDSCTVNWKDFLNTFQSQSSLSFDGRCRGQTKSSSPIQTKTSDPSEPLQQIQELVSGHLYELTRELMDLDPSNSTTVSKEQFRKLCGCHSLSLTVDQFESVWSRMPVNEHDRLQYREFLKRFGVLGRKPLTAAWDPTDSVSTPSPKPRETTSATKPVSAVVITQRTKSAPQCTSQRLSSAGRPATGSLADSMERRLCGSLQRCWKELQRKCIKEDPQHVGHISTTSFLEILNSLSMSVTQEQLQHLSVKNDIMTNGRVSYHNFLRHFLLNVKPGEVKMTRREPLLTAATRSNGVLSKDCVEVMLRICDVIRTSWTSIRRCFLMSDHTRTGTVSVQVFRKVLQHFSVTLLDEEFFHLCSYLDANTSGMIAYNNFLWAFLR